MTKRKARAEGHICDVTVHTDAYISFKKEVTCSASFSDGTLPQRLCMANSEGFAAADTLPAS